LIAINRGFVGVVSSGSVCLIDLESC